MPIQPFVAPAPGIVLAAVPALAAVAALCWGAFVPARGHRVPFGLTLLACAATGVLALYPGIPPFASGPLAPEQRVFAALVAATGVLATLFFHRYAARRDMADEAACGLILFAVSGMTLMAASDSWLLLFLGMQLFSISLYPLIGRRHDADGLEAALKYLLPSAVAGAVLLFGVAVLYAATCSLDMAARPVQENLCLLGLGLVFVGLGFKLSLAPVHIWTPDVYQGAPAPVAGLLSAGVKAATLGALVHVLLRTQPALSAAGHTAVRDLLLAASVLSMLIGNLTALKQTSLKRLVAYSSVAQMGYALLAAVSLAELPEALSATYLAGAAFVLAELAVFGAIAVISPREADRDALEEWRGASREHPLAAGLLVLGLLSLAGIPPLPGFWAKLAVFAAALKAGNVAAAVIGIATAIVAIFYYLRAVAVITMLSADAPRPRLVAVQKDALSAAAGALVVLGLAWLALSPGGLLSLAF